MDTVAGKKSYGLIENDQNDAGLIDEPLLKRDDDELAVLNLDHASLSCLFLQFTNKRTETLYRAHYHSYLGTTVFWYMLSMWLVTLPYLFSNVFNLVFMYPEIELEANSTRDYSVFEVNACTKPSGPNSKVFLPFDFSLLLPQVLSLNCSGRSPKGSLFECTFDMVRTCTHL